MSDPLFWLVLLIAVWGGALAGFIAGCVWVASRTPSAPNWQPPAVHMPLREANDEVYPRYYE